MTFISVVFFTSMWLKGMTEQNRRKLCNWPDSNYHCYCVIFVCA